jgi:hypothetical protein
LQHAKLKKIRFTEVILPLMLQGTILIKRKIQQKHLRCTYAAFRTHPAHKKGKPIT